MAYQCSELGSVFPPRVNPRRALAILIVGTGFLPPVLPESIPKAKKEGYVKAGLSSIT